MISTVCTPVPVDHHGPPGSHQLLLVLRRGRHRDVRLSVVRCQGGVPGLGSFLGRDTETVWRESETAAGGRL